jgi:hypothetical protein
LIGKTCEAKRAGHETRLTNSGRKRKEFIMGPSHEEIEELWEEETGTTESGTSASGTIQRL